MARVLWAAAAVLLAAAWGMGRAEIVLQDQAAAEQAKNAGVQVPGPGENQEPDQFDLVEFLNGDRLRGTFFSFDASAGVRWRHPAIRQILEMDPASIGSIRLNRPQGTNQLADQTCLVRLTNEDELVGELVTVDETNITLRTWYAGTLQIPRKLALTIAPGQAASSAIFEGPTTAEGWTRTKNSRFRRAGVEVERGWEYRNGAFYAVGNGSIGHNFELPDLSVIEFDVAWNGYLNLGIAFFTDNLENYGGDCYMLQLSSGSLYLQRMAKNGNSTNLGHSEASMLAQKPKARISLRSSKEKRNISLFIDDTLVKQWTDRGDFPTGKGLAFFQQGQGVVRLSKLRIAAWDGKLDQETATSAKGSEDLVKLGNNDQISGSLKAIREGKMSFGTEFATLEVPLNRIAQIELSADTREKSSRQPTDVRAVFTGRGSLTFSLDRWDDHQVVAQSPNFGQVKFLPGAFSRIDFNLNAERSDPDLLDLGGFDESASFQQIE